MEGQYYKQYSRCLDRDMEFKLYGSGPKLCVAFPPQNGRFFDFENFGMVDTLKPWLESGRITLVCPDGIDGETWSNPEGNPSGRIILQERWFQYIIQELLPWVQARCGTEGKALATGCSMGGFHAANFFFRHPDRFDTVISLSGLYHADYFFHDYMDDLVYANSPLHCLRNMPPDHPYLSLYRNSHIILCVGQGAWEDDLLTSTRRMEAVLREKQIPAWVDYWGTDVNHDWCWWQKQLPYFMNTLPL